MDRATESSVKTFLTAYPADFPWETNEPAWGVEDTIKLVGSDSPGFTGFMSQFAAPSHGNGVLKFLSRISKPSFFEWNSGGGWRSDWSQWRDRLIVFAYDWNGSLFGLDRAQMENGSLLVSILEQTPGTY